MSAIRRLRFDLAYDGTDFAGWQFQPGQRTVQGVLESVLIRINGNRPLRVRGASRTDSGVHARQQVADTLLCTGSDDESVAHALGCMLPADLRPRRVRTVPESFHSQYHAIGKTYRYELDLSRHGDPLRARYALHVGPDWDEAAVAEALRSLPGRRDWSGFAGSKCVVEDRVRTLSEASFARDGDRAWLRFSADGFLTYMVRNLVGTLVEVARAEVGPERVAEIAQTRRRDLAGKTVDPRGLVLWELRYPGRDEPEEALV